MQLPEDVQSVQRLFRMSGMMLAFATASVNAESPDTFAVVGTQRFSMPIVATFTADVADDKLSTLHSRLVRL